MQRLSLGSGAFCKQSLHLGIVLGSKRVKVRKGTTALLAKPQFSLSYNLSLSWQALTFIAHSHFFSLKAKNVSFEQIRVAICFWLSQGIKTFCPPTADGGAKAGFKMQRLSQGSGEHSASRACISESFWVQNV